MAKSRKVPDASDDGRTWPGILSALLAAEDLSAEDAAWAMNSSMSGEATDAQIAGFLMALRAKGETVEELYGLSTAMMNHAVALDGLSDSVDIVGTGGDRARTVNISTTAAIVIAACGERVVKHGNRASSSKSGAADVLEVLGVNLDLTPDDVARVARDVGITFCFAQVFHPAFRFAGPARRDLGVPTAFNLLGPLTNPARASSTAVGVADLQMAPLIAGVLGRRGIDGLVFRGDNGLDELTTTSTSDIWEVRSGAVEHSRFDPADLGLATATIEDLRGADAAFNARVTRGVLAGEHSPVRETVLLNAAAGLVAAERGTGSEPLMERLGRAYDRAAGAIDDGAATSVLDRWITSTR
ncbi:anthranilate phosphoribosyltransferase [Spelaeicoccus albus]|uniref:anthranilate phosphoribosyltransferase n=1 Tax=Spelaeicoccus albus TaxID=1280376 RepID=UPI0035572B68